MHVANKMAVGGVARKPVVIGLGVVEEARLRESLRRQSPSEPWVDAQFIEIHQIDGRGEFFVRRLHDASVFPPGGTKTRMVRCKLCEIFTPPNATEHGICLDHREDGRWGPSPSAAVIRTLQYRNLRLAPEMELEPESDEALAREIEEWKSA